MIESPRVFENGHSGSRVAYDSIRQCSGSFSGCKTYGRVPPHIVCGPAPCWIVVPLRGETAQDRAKPSGEEFLEAGCWVVDSQDWACIKDPNVRRFPPRVVSSFPWFSCLATATVSGRCLASRDDSC